MMLRPALPYVNRAGSENTDVSNHWSGVCGAFAFGSPLASGRWAFDVPTFARSPLSSGVTGMPLVAVKIADTCQSRATRFWSGS